MTNSASIIEFRAWLQSPAGRYLRTWEQAWLDQSVADAFGFHALQLGLPQIDALRANRMPHRWVATDRPLPPDGDDVCRVVLQCDFDALPFPGNSLDLVALPHALELARDPHLTLREVERVLVPEGRVVITGFNPASLWGVRQRSAHALGRLGVRSGRPRYLPNAGEFIGYWRMRDWLRLLSFEVDSGSFGCYRPPCRSDKWLERYRWVDPLGDRWWPVFGAVYALSAVKRVRGMRLVGLAKRDVRRARPSAAVVTQRRHETVRRLSLDDE